MELSATRIFVRDIAAAKQFYEQQLGLPLKADGNRDGYCVFKLGDVDLVIEVVADDAPQDDQALVGRFTGLSFKVDDIVAKHLALQAAGVRFTGAPEKQFWGGVLATFEDPSGNALQIVELPAAGGSS